LIQPTPFIGTPKDAGVYHVSTGTWTRHASQASVGADIIYGNDCFSNAGNTGYIGFGNLNGNVLIDEGVLPSPTHPANLNEQPGCSTSYVVDGFQVSFCTDQDKGSTGTFTYTFYESYASCSAPVGLPTFSVTLPNGGPNGLPGNYGFTAGQSLCWFLLLDTAAGAVFPVPTFTMQADSDGTFDGTQDTFGIALDSSLPVSAGGTPTAGCLIAGNVNRCTGYDGTRWDPVVNYAERGTGMGNLNQFWNDTAGTCNGYILNVAGDISAYYLLLAANACGPVGPFPVGTDYCFGDGTATPCSCGGGTPNPSAVGANEGCANSITAGVGAKLRASAPNSGTAVIADDQSGANAVTLKGTQMPNSSCLYFQGTIRQNGGLGTAFGDGLRCAGGTVIRLGTKTNAAGASQYPDVGDLAISVRGALTALTPPVTRTYQAWYRNAAVFCVATATFNLSNSTEIVWN
jgi:hypothetical protein